MMIRKNAEIIKNLENPSDDTANPKTFFRGDNEEFGSGLAFLCAYIPAAVLFLTPILAEWVGSQVFLAALPLIVFFVLIPLCDSWIGHTTAQYVADKAVFWRSPKAFVSLLVLAVPLQMFLIVWAAGVFLSGQFSLAGNVFWVLGVGLVAAGLGITVAHELVHKSGFWLPSLGGLLLTSVCYPGFKVEHVRGHHVNVATPLDPTTARFRQSIFSFLPHAIYHNVRQAFVLEEKRLQHKGLAFWHWKNEMLWWWSISALWALFFLVIMGLGGLLFFLAQALVAIVTLETINYVEHYGLERKRQSNGKYERVSAQHSWNSNYLLSNLMLFQLQRHSDHHARPKVLYSELAPCEGSPQLPFGYPTMLLMAWVPWLWFRVMDPKVERWRQVNATEYAST